MRLKRETQGAFCVLKANAKSQTRKSMKINGPVDVLRMTLLILYYILYIAKRLAWADNMFCVPEQLVDSDVVAREMARIAW